MKSIFSVFVLLLMAGISFAQVDPSKIDIVRDKYGVPHIFAKTDAEVAYGLASIGKEKALQLLLYAKGYFMEHFKTTEVTLGMLQFLVRGNKAIPLSGLPDVLAAMYSVPYKDGKIQGAQGESYIELVRFTKAGPIIETVNCYGASNKKTSPHYADQMELFAAHQTKPMTLNKEEVYRNAERVYHPK